MTFDLSYVNALSTGGVITPSFVPSDATVDFSVPSVTVPAHGTAFVDATITPASQPVTGQYGGYIAFTPRGGGPASRGAVRRIRGRLPDIQVLVSTRQQPLPACHQPDPGYLHRRWTRRLVSASASVSTRAIAPAVPYTLTGTDFPYFAMRFGHQARVDDRSTCTT